MQEDRPFTQEQQKAAETIAKLLQLGHRNPSAEEAALALNRAADLALKHNLDLAAIKADAGDERRQEKVSGGFYDHQVWLWAEIAKLNFCYHFVDGEYVKERRVGRFPDGTRYEWYQPIWRRHHALIGRRHNVAATRAMATYLEQAVERLVREELEARGLNPNTNRFSRWAVSFRKGAVLDICQRLRERRAALELEETQRQAEAEARAAAAGMSTETAVTIASLRQTEEDANRDVLEGKPPGTNARERAERAQARREAEEAYTRWAAANPEEAAKQEAERKREAEKRAAKLAERSRRAGRGYWKDTDWGAFGAGERRSKTVGLDPQQDTGVGKGRGIGNG